MFDNTHFSRFLCYIPPSPASPAPTPRLPSIFPELSPLIHNIRLSSSLEGLSGGANNMDDSSSSDMQGAQIPEDSNHEAFDYGDEDDPDLNTTDAPMYELNESQVAINSLGSQSASRLDGENTHLQNDSVLADPDLNTLGTRSSTPALSYVDDEDPDAASQLSQVLLGNDVPIPHHDIALDPSSILMEQDIEDRLSMISRPSTPAIEPLTQNFLDGSQLECSLSGSPDHTQTMVGSWEILMKEDDEAFEPPRLPASEPALAASDTYFDINAALNGRTCETPQSSNSSKEEPDDAIHEVDSPRCSNTGLKDRRDSFTSNETHESFESCQSESSPQSSPSSPSSLTLPLESRTSTPEDHHDLKSDEIPQSDLECPHDMIDIEDSNEQLEYNVDTTTFTLPIDIISVTPPGSPILEGLSQFMIPGALLQVDANIQSAATSSTDNDSIVDSEVNSTPSPSRPSAPASGDHDLNFDDIPSTITLPVDIIDVTPPGSPILEGLSQFMIPGVLEVNQDNVSTPVQRDIPTGERTLWPSSEAPRLELPSSSGNEQSLRGAQATNLPESLGPNAEITIQPDSPYPHHLSHVQVQDSHLEVPTSPLERIQSGLLRLIPTYYALSGETINRTT